MPDVCSECRRYGSQEVFYTNLASMLKNHLPEMRSHRLSRNRTKTRWIIDSNSPLQVGQQQNYGSLFSAFKKTWQKFQAEMKIEFPYDLAGDLHVRNLILAYWH